MPLGKATIQLAYSCPDMHPAPREPDVPNVGLGTPSSTLVGIKTKFHFHVLCIWL